MNIKINPDALFSTSEASRMLNVEGLSPSRIRLLAERGKVPWEPSKHYKETGKTVGGRYGHIRIRFKDFPKIIKAHESHRRIGVSTPKMTKDDLQSLVDRVEWLEKALYHELGLERVDRETVSG